MTFEQESKRVRTDPDSTIEQWLEALARGRREGANVEALLTFGALRGWSE